jgi:FkbM family methyltransferase
MTSMVPPLLFLKSLIVGTPLERAACKLRWFLGVRKRHKHPELWELYLEERWLPVILQRLLVSDSRCVDVGCHIGSFLSLLKRYAPNGRHVAFEASVTKSRWLKKRFPNVEVFPCAVADKTGRAFFEENYALPGYSHLLRSESQLAKNLSTYEVQVCCLDDVLLDDGKVDLIKVDIEGGELAALRGSYKLIKKWGPAIIFECGSEYGLVEEKLSRRDLYDFITGDLNYKIFCFADFIFNKEELTFDEFRKCGLYPFRGFNFVAIPRPAMNISAV